MLIQLKMQSLLRILKIFNEICEKFAFYRIGELEAKVNKFEMNSKEVKEEVKRK